MNNNQNHRIDKKIQRQDRFFSTSLNKLLKIYATYATEKSRETYFNMLSTIYDTIQDNIDILQELHVKQI